MIQTDPYIWLYAIDLPTDPPTKLRVAAYPETVYFETDSTGVSIAYVPFSISHGEVRTDVEGGSPTVTLNAQNVSLEMSALLETYGYLVGQRVRTVLVKLSDLPLGTPLIDELYEILDGEVTESRAAFTMGQSALEQKSFPDHRVTRDYCTSHYGGTRCGYDTKRVGALQTCDKTLSGANGCRVHGESEAAASLPVLHPKRFRAFPGVQRQGGTGLF